VRFGLETGWVGVGARLPSQSRKGRQVSHTRKRVGALAVLVAGALAGTIVIGTGVASASSRGFRIFNDSSHPLRLVGATKAQEEIRNPEIIVVPDTPMDFERRPKDGHVIEPHGPPQVWELKHSSGGEYAAVLTYDIERTSSPYAPLRGHLKVIIQTTPLSNNSDCFVHITRGV
jgi:hypothetical protein